MFSTTVVLNACQARNDSGSLTPSFTGLVTTAPEDDDVEGLVALLGHSPQHFGSPAANWTVPLLRERLPRDGGRRVRNPPCAANSAAWGMSGSGLGTSSIRTPSARKKRRIARRLRALPDMTAILAEDETDLLLLPPLRGGWARGEPLPVSISGRNARRVIFGALSLRTGHRLLLPRERQRAGDFQEFLRHVRRHYRRWPVAMVLERTRVTRRRDRSGWPSGWRSSCCGCPNGHQS